MSAAVEEAWREWQLSWVLEESRAGRLAGYTGNELQHAAFVAGYHAREIADEDRL